MTTLDEIKYVDWQPKLNEIGEVAQGIDDINQCIYIILTTQKGSVPHRPTFGSDIFKYVDYPVQEAIPNIIREVIDAISQWETRVEINQVTAELDEFNVKIKIEWKLVDSDTIVNHIIEWTTSTSRKDILLVSPQLNGKRSQITSVTEVVV